MRKSLLALLACTAIACTNYQDSGIPSSAEVKFVSLGDTFRIFDELVQFSKLKNDTAWFKYSSETGGLKHRNNLAYEFPPDKTVNWGVVYLNDSSAGVASWRVLFLDKAFWNK